ncbi:MAG: hypothetical protein COA79_11240 [Planctomycetota bacterium]|nr:MAG: hypothetical protein COA79_11240 [Planctomycetota bacterium]
MISKTILRELNQILKTHLTSINQFFIHSKIQKKQGFVSISQYYFKMGIDNGKSSEKIIEYLIENDEIPQIKDYDLLNVDTHLKTQYKLDLGLLLSTLSHLHACIHKCQKSNHTDALPILTEVLTTIENQVDWIESQRSIINSVGIDSYCEELQLAKY